MARFLALLVVVSLATVLGCKKEDEPILSCANGPDQVNISLVFDEEKLEEYDVTKETVHDSLTQKFRTSMSTGLRDYGELDSVVVGTHNGSPILIMDVAEVKLAFFRRGEPWGASSDSASPTESD